MEQTTMPAYKAVIQQTKDWWIGWIEEIPGVSSQGRTRDELLENLRSALREALEMNRADARAAAAGAFEEASVEI
jgi:predicted RNase H-like HicB family nuclease